MTTLRKIEILILYYVFLGLCRAELIYWDDSDGNSQSAVLSSSAWLLFLPVSKDVKNITAIDPMINVVQIEIYNNNLVEFPDFTACCASQLLEIYMFNNKITSIDPARMDALSSLRVLWIHLNRLASFPDVPGPGGTLVTLALSTNMLPELPSLSNYTYLKNLYLSKNPITASEIDLSANTFGQNQQFLTLNSFNAESLVISDPSQAPPLVELRFESNSLVQFPDISPLAPTLTKLLLNDNNLNDVISHSSRINSLTNLDTLELDGNDMTTFGNVCKLRPLAILSLKRNRFHCDCKLRWLKAVDLMNSTTHAIVVDSCATPPEMTNGNWADQTLEDFNCNDSVRTYKAKRFIDAGFEFHCELPLIEETTNARGISDCAARCMSAEKCLFIKYYLHNEQYVCTLMKFDLIYGTWNQNASFQDWYIIE